MNVSRLLKRAQSSLALVLLAIAFNGISLSASAKIFTKTEEAGDTIKTVVGVPQKPEDISPLLVGEAIPQVKLVNVSGETVDLNAAIAAKPTILVFYRGGWCPYCTKELAGLQEIEEDLTKMGYQVIAISTDSPDNLKGSAAKGKLTYTLLSDADLSVSKQFGLAFKSPKNYDSFLPAASGGKNIDKLLPVPSVFILSKQGIIRFEYINPNYKQRISSALLKAAASALQNEL